MVNEYRQAEYRRNIATYKAYRLRYSEYVCYYANNTFLLI